MTHVWIQTTTDREKARDPLIREDRWPGAKTWQIGNRSESAHGLRSSSATSLPVSIVDGISSRLYVFTEQSVVNTPNTKRFHYVMSSPMSSTTREMPCSTSQWAEFFFHPSRNVDSAGPGVQLLGLPAICYASVSTFRVRSRKSSISSGFSKPTIQASTHPRPITKRMD